MPEIASPILVCGLGRGVGRLDRLLAGAEGLDLGLQPLRGQGELLLLGLQLGVLGLQVGDLGWRPDRRVSASRARSSRPAASACWAWPCSLSAAAAAGCIWSSSRLRLVATSATPRRTFGSSSQLLLVGVVEGLARVLGAVERLVGLRPEDQVIRLTSPPSRTPLYRADVARHRAALRVPGYAVLFPSLPATATRRRCGAGRADGSAGKGRPTPKRRDAERRPNAPGPLPRTARRPHRTGRQPRRPGHQAQGPAQRRRPLPAAARQGPGRRYVRDFVDSGAPSGSTCWPARGRHPLAARSPDHTLRGSRSWPTRSCSYGSSAIDLPSASADAGSSSPTSTPAGGPYGAMRSMQLRRMRLPRPRSGRREPLTAACSIDTSAAAA